MFMGYTFAILSAVIYGCMPLMSKYIYAEGINSLTLVFLRNFLALPSLGVLAYFERKSFKIPLKTFFGISGLSLLGCSLTPVLLFSSYNYLSGGAATVFHFVYPSLVVLIGVVFLKKKLGLGTIISVALCFVGIALFYNPNDGFSLTGAVLSLGSGLAFSVFVVLMTRFESLKTLGLTFSFYIALWSSIIMFIACVVTNSLTLPTTALGWGLCVLFATLVTTGAVVLFQQGAFIIGGEKASILSTLEPITGVVLGIVVFGESSSVAVIIGSVLVVSASIIIALMDMKKAR